MSNATTPVKLTAADVAALVELNENRGRKYLSQIISAVMPNLTSLSFSDNPFSRWDSAAREQFTVTVDGVTTQEDRKYIIEIKCREMESTRYADYMIEDKKFTYLMNTAANGYIPLYVNFFTDGTCLIWDLRYEMDAENRDIYCNKVTVNPNAGKVNRSRKFLLRKNATAYNYTV